MKNSIAKMKQELKLLASEIKQLKKQRSKENNGYVAGLNSKRVSYRHKHVAYCLVRGTPLEKIDSGIDLDRDRVNWIVESMKEESSKNHKLYVVVRDDLSPAQQAVQAGHAVAEFLKTHPHTQWSNGYLIYLKDRKNYHDNVVPHYRVYTDCEYAEFKEPDLGNKVTAYAAYGYQADVLMKQKVLL